MRFADTTDGLRTDTTAPKLSASLTNTQQNAYSNNSVTQCTLIASTNNSAY